MSVRSFYLGLVLAAIVVIMVVVQLAVSRQWGLLGVFVSLVALGVAPGRW